MLERLIYKNHMNEVFDFGKDGIYLDSNDIRDFEWKVTTKNNRISAIDYAVRKKKLPVIIICESEERGIEARNRLFEIAEKDVLAMKHGQIIVGDYYMKGFITKSAKKDYLISKRYMKLTLTLTTDFPYWVKETQTTYQGRDTEIDSKTVVAQSPNGLPGIPVDSGGNYTDESGQQWICDEVDFARGVYVQRIYKFTCRGSSAADMSQYAGIKENVTNFREWAHSDLPAGVKILCDSLPFDSGNWQADTSGCRVASATHVDYTLPYDLLGITSEATGSERVAAAKTYLANNPMIFLLPLSTSTETALTSEELAAYAALQTYRPNTSITNDADVFMSAVYTNTDGETQNVSGTKIAMNDCADAKLSGLTIYGKTTQDGTPSPENPVDLVSAGQSGTISITVVGVQSFGMDHPFDYPFEWYQSMQSQALINTGFVASNFRLIIYGACVNPSISINGHEYQVECTVNSGEYLTIDSVTKKIFLTAVDGTTTNKFNNRNRDSYIFEKIQPGSNIVAWDGTFGFGVILLEERSEPKWT